MNLVETHHVSIVFAGGLPPPPPPTPTLFVAAQVCFKAHMSLVETRGPTRKAAGASSASWTHHSNTLCQPYDSATMSATTFGGCKDECIGATDCFGFIWNPTGSLSESYPTSEGGACKMLRTSQTPACNDPGGGHWDSFERICVEAGSLFKYSAMRQAD